MKGYLIIIIIIVVVFVLVALTISGIVIGVIALLSGSKKKICNPCSSCGEFDCSSPNCTWDLDGKICREQQCKDIWTEDSCLKKSGCNWDDTIDSPVPCVPGKPCGKCDGCVNKDQCLKLGCGWNFLGCVPLPRPKCNSTCIGCDKVGCDKQQNACSWNTKTNTCEKKVTPSKTCDNTCVGCNETDCKTRTQCSWSTNDNTCMTECNANCKNGTCHNQQCKCNKNWTGPWCNQELCGDHGQQVGQDCVCDGGYSYDQNTKWCVPKCKVYDVKDAIRKAQGLPEEWVDYLPKVSDSCSNKLEYIPGMSWTPEPLDVGDSCFSSACPSRNYPKTHPKGPPYPKSSSEDPLKDIIVSDYTNSKGNDLIATCEINGKNSIIKT